MIAWAARYGGPSLSIGLLHKRTRCPKTKLIKQTGSPENYAHVSYCNFAMREPILKILGALERGAQGAFNTPKSFKIGPTVKKLQHQTCA